MVSRRPELQDEIRLHVMRLLHENPKRTTRELARLVGVSNGSAYYLLQALLEKGHVKLDNFAHSPNKSQYMYILTPQGISEKLHLTRRFLTRKMDEYERLKREIKRLESEVERGGDLGGKGEGALSFNGDASERLNQQGETDRLVRSSQG
ncbi:MAG: MarR family EPS-associated transcriptional regulator [Alphaproteobacteria bacterium]